MAHSTSYIPNTEVTVRHAHVGDEAALARLAALDGARPLAGPVLVAESDARLLAALPLGSGRPIADPFEPTAELVSLLELRAAQLDEEPRRRGVGDRLRALLRMRPAHGRA
jgi:hypothetical protein